MYGLDANKSVELTIPALAVGGPVRTRISRSNFFVTLIYPLATSAPYSPARGKSLYVPSHVLAC